jgi:tetratricopeptide (TPR) repeat protein
MATSSRRKAAPPEKSAPRADASRGDHGGTAPAAVSLPVAAREQAEVFDRAISLFHARKYAAARGLFESAATGPAREMAHSARLHAQMCARRVEAAEPSLRTPEEHYNYAIALINARKLAEAEKHLTHAISHEPGADHIHYALALCRGLAGDIHGAYHHLRRAIEIHSRNRIAARNDPDFAAIVRLSPVSELLYPKRAASE